MGACTVLPQKLKNQQTKLDDRGLFCLTILKLSWTNFHNSYSINNLEKGRKKVVIKNLLNIKYICKRLRNLKKPDNLSCHNILK